MTYAALQRILVDLQEVLDALADSRLAHPELLGHLFDGGILAFAPIFYDFLVQRLIFIGNGKLHEELRLAVFVKVQFAFLQHLKAFTRLTELLANLRQELQLISLIAERLLFDAQ